MTRTLTPPFQSEYDRMVRAFEQTIRRMKAAMADEAWKAYPLLVRYGWYPDLSWPMSVEDMALDLLMHGRTRAADSALTEYFGKRSAGIARELTLTYPRRAPALRSAFWAHNRRRYYLSIPVFLSQADGICSDILGTQLFKKRRNKLLVAAAIEAAGDEFWAAMLLPISVVAPISTSTEVDRPFPAGALNRHAVLHGQSLDYANRVNSCKAISLVNFVGTALPLFRRTPVR